MSTMNRIQWLECWDELRHRVIAGNTSWGRNQILELMDDIERRKVREAEKSIVEQIHSQPVKLETRD